MKKLFRTSAILALLTAIVLLSSCTNNKTPLDVKSGVETVNAEWTRDAVLYELNVRQFTDEGTFAAVEGHIERLKDLGVDVIWFMPVHPIGKIERKGTLGSYYSVADFMDVNPEFGTMDEFKSLGKVFRITIFPPPHPGLVGIIYSCNITSLVSLSCIGLLEVGTLTHMTITNGKQAFGCTVIYRIESFLYYFPLVYLYIRIHSICSVNYLLLLKV